MGFAVAVLAAAAGCDERDGTASGADTPRGGEAAASVASSPAGERDGRASRADVPPDGAATAKAADPPAAEREVRAFCSACHAYPPPGTLPRSSGREEVETMYTLAEELGGAELAAGAPPLERTLEHFVSRAPDRLRRLGSTARQGPGGYSVRARPLRLAGFGPYPGVANLRLVRLTSPDGPARELLLTDMRFGQIFLLRIDRQGRPIHAARLGHVSHPARSSVVDLDRDGRLDVLVANLGTVTPSDVTDGSVEWLRRQEGGFKFRRIPLAEGLGRTADARAADFDGDGDLDVLAAVFGWRKVGRILLLENRGGDPDAPDFAARTLDPRPGAIDVPIADLDEDGDPDFVALISQHHETVVAFLNDGQGEFTPHPVFTAPHPNWGSSGIDLVDLDRDGDLDVLFVNGDTLDDLVAKPWHGVSWLENRGEFPFVHHRLTELYGAQAAEAADLDGDGDLDLAVCAFLPALRRDDASRELVESVIWLEQTGPGVFRRHPLETAAPWHPTLVAGDFDGDGDPDLVVGNMTLARGEEEAIDHPVLWLENTGP